MRGYRHEPPCCAEGSVTRWLIFAGIRILLIFAMTLPAVIAGLAVWTAGGGSAFSCPLVFLPLMSSAFVDSSLMRGPVAWRTENRPLIFVVNIIRVFSTQAVAYSIVRLSLGK